MSEILEKLENFSEENFEQNVSGFPELYEIIDGAKCVVGVPTKEHQRVVFEIAKQLGIYLENKSCEVYISPYALNVREFLGAIPFDFKDRYYYPDIVVICENAKTTKEDLEEIPSFIVEVASPSTFYNDMNGKLRVYERMGVKEYWVVVNPFHVLTYVLGEDGYQVKGYKTLTGVLTIPVTIFPDLSIVLDESKLFKVLKFIKT